MQCLCSLNLLQDNRRNNIYRQISDRIPKETSDCHTESSLLTFRLLESCPRMYRLPLVETFLAASPADEDDEDAFSCEVAVSPCPFSCSFDEVVVVTTSSGFTLGSSSVTSFNRCSFSCRSIACLSAGVGRLVVLLEGVVFNVVDDDGFFVHCLFCGSHSNRELDVDVDEDGAGDSPFSSLLLLLLSSRLEVARLPLLRMHVHVHTAYMGE